MDLLFSLFFDEIVIDGKKEYLISYLKVFLAISIFVNFILFFNLALTNFTYYILGCKEMV